MGHPLRRLRSILIPSSLQSRLTVGVVLATAVGIGGITAWTGWRVQQILLTSHAQKVRIIADRFQDDVALYSAIMPPQEAAQRVIDHRTTGDLALWVKATDGTVMAQSDTLTMGSWQTAGISEPLLALEGAPGETVMPLEDWRLVLCVTPLAVPLADSGQAQGTLYLAADITTDYASLQQLLRTLAVAATVTLILLAVATAFYIRRTLSPIRKLNRAASTITADTLAHHGVLDLEAAPYELQELARTYNLMLDRLARAWQQQKRFVSDLSHELRTPLSLVQGYLQSTLRRCQTLTPPQREGLEIAASETERTVHLLRDLLELARLENQPVDWQTVDLHGAVEAAVLTASAGIEQDGGGDRSPGQAGRGQGRGNAIECDRAKHDRTESNRTGGDRIVTTGEPAPLVVATDPGKFTAALLALLDNALRHSPAHCPVTVGLHHQGDWALVQVDNQGPAIPLAHQPHLFEPFYRVEADRCRSSGGTGLGLTLANARVKALGGRLDLQSRPGHTRFTISLPTSPPRQETRS